MSDIITQPKQHHIIESYLLETIYYIKIALVKINSSKQ